MAPFPWNIAADRPVGLARVAAAGAWDEPLRLARAGRTAEAVAAWAVADPAEGAPPSGAARRWRARQLADGAHDAAAAGEVGRALELLGQALAEVPGSAELRAAQARLLRHAGDAAGARAALAAGRRPAAGHPAVAIEHALLEAAAGRLGEAVGELEALGRGRRPADGRLFRRAMARLRAGQWEAAEDLLAVAYRTGAHAPALALREVGRLLEGGDPSRALEAALGAAESHAGEAAAHEAVGLACLALGWGDDALEAFGRALACDPGCHTSRLYRAWTLFLAGETTAAEGEVLRVLAAAPGHELALRLWRERCGRRAPLAPGAAAPRSGKPRSGAQAKS